MFYVRSGSRSGKHAEGGLLHVRGGWKRNVPIYRKHAEEHRVGAARTEEEEPDGRRKYRLQGS